jgi:hypothetical protein
MQKCIQIAERIEDPKHSLGIFGPETINAAIS